MSKAKVKVVGAYVDGHGPGSIISVDGEVANYLEKLGYGEIQKDVEKPKEEAKTEPKAEAKSESKPKGKRKSKSKDDK
jgi:hypothetical protein